MNIIKDLTSVNCNQGRNGNGIKYLVYHFTGNVNDTARGNANYFRDEDRQASANYFIDDNEIIQVVKDEDTAWHCGDGYGKYGIRNNNSIGIEMCGTNGGISEKTINNAIELGRMLKAKYSITDDCIVRHYDASRKCCPEPMSANNWEAWWNFKAKLLGTNGSNIVTSPDNPTQNSSVDVIYQTYTNGRWLPNVTNLEDYAGIFSQEVQCVYANSSRGCLKYRVHTKCGNWLPWVTDRTDYAGIFGQVIDGIQFYLEGYQGNVRYRTYCNDRWLPWVVDTQDYAGIFGQAIEGLQVEII